MLRSAGGARVGMGLLAGLRTAPRLTAGLRQGIALMSLSGADLLAWATVAAAENPAIRIRMPEGGSCRARSLMPKGWPRRVTALSPMCWPVSPG